MHFDLYLYTKILEVNLFAFAYRLFRRDFSPLDGTYCMGTHSFLQLYMYFVLIWEGFMNGYLYLYKFLIHWVLCISDIIHPRYRGYPSSYLHT